MTKKFQSDQIHFYIRSFSADSFSIPLPITLLEAIQINDRHIVESLIVEQQLDLSNQSNPLLKACENNRLDIARILLLFGSNPNLDSTSIKHDSFNLSPLHLAVRQNLNAGLQLATSLLDCGAFIEAKCEEGKTPLHYAVDSNSIDCVHLLINRACLVDSIDKNGKTPLMSAAFNGNFSLVRMLIENGASKDCVDYKGLSTFDYATKSSNMNKSRILAYLRDPNAVIEQGVDSLCDEFDSINDWNRNPNTSIGNPIGSRISNRNSIGTFTGNFVGNRNGTASSNRRKGQYTANLSKKNSEESRRPLRKIKGILKKKTETDKNFLSKDFDLFNEFDRDSELLLFKNTNSNNRNKNKAKSKIKTKNIAKTSLRKAILSSDSGSENEIFNEVNKRAMLKDLSKHRKTKNRRNKYLNSDSLSDSYSDYSLSSNSNTSNSDLDSDSDSNSTLSSSSYSTCSSNEHNRSRHRSKHKHHYNRKKHSHRKKYGRHRHRLHKSCAKCTHGADHNHQCCHNTHNNHNHYPNTSNSNSTCNICSVSTNQHSHIQSNQVNGPSISQPQPQTFSAPLNPSNTSLNNFKYPFQSDYNFNNSMMRRRRLAEFNNEYRYNNTGFRRKNERGVFGYRRHALQNSFSMFGNGNLRNRDRFSKFRNQRPNLGISKSSKNIKQRFPLASLPQSKTDVNDLKPIESSKILESETTPTNTGNNITDKGLDEKSNRSDSKSSDPNRVCCICFESNKNVLFLPCKHVCCCESCALDGLEKCPLCDSKISEKFRVFV